MTGTWEERYEPSKKQWQSREKNVGDFRLRVEYQGADLWALHINHSYTSWSNGGIDPVVNSKVDLVASYDYPSSEAACQAGDHFLAQIVAPALEEQSKAAYARGLEDGRKQVLDEYVKQLRYIASSRRSSMEHHSKLADKSNPADPVLRAEAERYRIEADEIDHIANMLEKGIKP